MKIIHKSSGKLICSNAGIANTFFSRFRGLMFSGKKNLLFEFEKTGIISASIHMMFVGFPIDVVWIDEDKKAVDVQRNIKPFSIIKPSTWKIYKPKKPAKYLLELADEKLTEEIKEGDEFEFLENS